MVGKGRGVTILESVLIIACVALVAFYGIRYLGRITNERNCSEMAKSTLLMNPQGVRATFHLPWNDNLNSDEFIGVVDTSGRCLLRRRFATECPPDAPPDACDSSASSQELQIWP